MWLADANYAQTSGYDADVRMTWQGPMTGRAINGRRCEWLAFSGH